MRISDWSSDVCSSDLMLAAVPAVAQDAPGRTPIYEAAPQSDAHLPRVAIETSAGTITGALATECAPVTANNFLASFDQHKVAGVTFSRAVKVTWRIGFVHLGVKGGPRMGRGLSRTQHTKPPHKS